jgi:ArsR family transcriptional regulator
MQNIDPVRVFSTLSNQTRLRCLHLVYINDDVCVCEVVGAMGISQPAASKALGALKAIGLLNSRRDANWTYYSMSRDLPGWLESIVEATMLEVREHTPFTGDQAALKQLELRQRSVA